MWELGDDLVWSEVITWSSFICSRQRRPPRLCAGQQSLWGQCTVDCAGAPRFLAHGV